ncbi:MoaD/ThiS family protein, partial [Streptomyces cellulosae]
MTWERGLGPMSQRHRTNSGVAAALNETVVPRAQWPATPQSEGDRVEVL